MFIEGFSSRAKPLSDLLKKTVPFEWTNECSKSFEDLTPKFRRTFYFYYGCFRFCSSAVLSQREIGNDRPIAYMSHIMKPAENNYTTTEKECLAIIYAVLHFRPHLYGREFTLVCEHEPLKWIDSVKSPVQRLIRWSTRLREYQYKFLHKPGRLNVNADALSRNPVESQAAVFPISSAANVANTARQATASHRGRPTGSKNKPLLHNLSDSNTVGSNDSGTSSLPS